MDVTTLSKIIAESRPLSFGDVLGQSFNLFKKVWLQGFLIFILTFACIFPFYLLFYVPLVFMGVTDLEMLRQVDISVPIGIWMILFLPILFLVVLFVSTAFVAAFLRICKQKDLEEPGRDEYFYYFKGKYFTKIMVLVLISLGLSILGMLLCGVGLIYLIVPLSLIPVIFAFNPEISPKAIVKSSFQLGNKNWLVIFGLLSIMGIIAEMGVILCGVGLLFTAMLAKIPLYYMYKDSVGFETKDPYLVE